MIVITPVVGLPESKPLKPAEAVAVTLATEPLSAGATVGVTVALLPVTMLVFG